MRVFSNFKQAIGGNSLFNFVTLLLALASCVAAIIVIPEVRGLLSLDQETPTEKVIEKIIEKPVYTPSTAPEPYSGIEEELPQQHLSTRRQQRQSDLDTPRQELPLSARARSRQQSVLERESPSPSVNSVDIEMMKLKRMMDEKSQRFDAMKRMIEPGYNDERQSDLDTPRQELPLSARARSRQQSVLERESPSPSNVDTEIALERIKRRTDELNDAVKRFQEDR